jgi:hypothetical protein
MSESFKALLSYPVKSPDGVFNRLLWLLSKKQETRSVEVQVASDDIQIEDEPAVPFSKIARCEYRSGQAQSVEIEYFEETGIRRTLSLSGLLIENLYERISKKYKLFARNTYPCDLCYLLLQR